MDNFKTFLKVLGSAAVVLMLTVVLFSFPKANATGGTAQLGDECNVHASDASHICSAGLVCVPTNDHSEGNGKCQSTVTPTPTPTHAPTATPTPTGVQPTATPTPTGAPTATPTINPCQDNENCVTATPTPTVEPTATPAPSNNGGGHGDGLSDGRSSCPECTQPPHVQQAVLGASTMAGTGTFEENTMNVFGSLGILLMATSGIFYAKTKKAFN